jgi:hypothetical protein
MIPRKGFQKYQDLINSLTVFGLGVVVQLLSIYIYIFIYYDAKIIEYY